MQTTKISEVKAKEYINNYRVGLPAGSLRSTWFNRDIIDAIVALSATSQLDGLRIYLAKYSEDDPDGRFTKDDVTLIAVPTQSGFVPADGKDISDAYYNYSKPCPPHCEE